MSADLRIDEELRICEAATDGPWKEFACGVLKGPFWVVSNERGWEQLTTFGNPADATFIAHARTGYPVALRELARLRELLAGVYRIDCAGQLGSIQGDVTLTEDDLAEVKEILGISTKEQA